MNEVWGEFYLSFHWLKFHRKLTCRTNRARGENTAVNTEIKLNGLPEKQQTTAAVNFLSCPSSSMIDLPSFFVANASGPEVLYYKLNCRFSL